MGVLLGPTILESGAPDFWKLPTLGPGPISGPGYLNSAALDSAATNSLPAKSTWWPRQSGGEASLTPRMASQLILCLSSRTSLGQMVTKLIPN